MARNKLRRTNRKFGSLEWVEHAVKIKFTRTEEHDPEEIATMSDYLNYRKLHGILWPRKRVPNTVIWIDPPDFRRGTDKAA